MIYDNIYDIYLYIIIYDIFHYIYFYIYLIYDNENKLLKFTAYYILLNYIKILLIFQIHKRNKLRE